MDETVGICFIVDSGCIFDEFSEDIYSTHMFAEIERGYFFVSYMSFLFI